LPIWPVLCSSCCPILSTLSKFGEQGKEERSLFIFPVYSNTVRVLFSVFLLFLVCAHDVSSLFSSTCFRVFAWLCASVSYCVRESEVAYKTGQCAWVALHVVPS
jgi:hypothetical protein